MHIEYAQVINYASFADSGRILLSPSMNLFIGANNSGKSSFLRALVGPLENKPKRPVPEIHAGKSSLNMGIRIAAKELFDRHGNTRISFPCTQDRSQSVPVMQHMIESNEELLLEGVRVADGGMQPLTGGSLEVFRNGGNPASAEFQIDQDGSIRHIGGSSSQDVLLTFIDRAGSKSIFYFSSQRVNVGSCDRSLSDELSADASNLPRALSNIQNERPYLFDVIERTLSEIVPGISRITIPQNAEKFDILLWSKDPSTDVEISFPLNDSGSGVAQLLAILTAIIIHDQSCIIIDEINTYLHPAAIKKLFRIIQTSYPQHQYIISCHSPDVIFSAREPKLFNVEKNGFSSEIKEISLKSAEEAKFVAGKLGFSMLDVFGNDRIIWVEGPTEEALFPYILEKAGEPITPEYGFASVGTNSSFAASTNRRDEVIFIYENAGRRLAPLLLGMAFGLDRENLNDESVKSIERSKRKLRFLHRRCVENYFLDPHAIATLLNGRGETVSATDVENEMRLVAKSKDFGAHGPSQGAFGSAAWYRWIDGAKVLRHVFQTMTESRHEFRKTSDNIELASIIWEKDPTALDELIRFVRGLVEIAGRDSKP